MTDYKIIDALCYLPTQEVMLDLVTSLPPQMAGYLRNVFGPRIAPLLGMEAEELYQLKITKTEEELQTILAPKFQPLTRPIDEFIRELDEMGVEKAVIFNLDEETPSGLKGLPNDYYAEIVKRYPDKFLGFAGIDPMKGMEAVKEIRRSYQLGLRGIAVRPFMFGIPPHHAKMYPLYTVCSELNIPIWFHLSINYSTQTMEVERPIYLDIVAQDFPDLKMIAGHGGWPWVQEMTAVAWRNSNIYIDIASYMPKYMSRPGSGWESLLHYGNSVLQDQVIFGSTWLFMGLSVKQLADQVMELPLKETVKRKWLYENAARLFSGV
ncbi:amidohydrolase family protein [bacterium]|nr:amidohydrolase family protein [bacterium]